MEPAVCWRGAGFGLGIELCWPASPEQKGSIENLVGWVKGSFFKQRRFLDDADLLLQLAERHTEVNTQRPSRATGVMPAVRLEEERPRLRPLKIAPADLALRVPVVVGPTAEVLHGATRPLRSVLDVRDVGFTVDATDGPYVDADQTRDVGLVVSGLSQYLNGVPFEHVDHPFPHCLVQ
jgi:hypothetical protein